MKKISTLLLMVVALGALAGCNTVDGFGKDVQQSRIALFARTF